MPIRKWLSALLDKRFAPSSNTNITVRTTVHIAISLVSLVLSTALLVGATNNAFIYTRF